LSGLCTSFFDRLVPWKGSKSLRQFMTLKGEEFNSKHPIVYETVCRELVYHLRLDLDNPKTNKLMVDLVAQPDLLTLTVFVKGFLHIAGDYDRSNFIKYGWNEAIQEGLKMDYEEGGRELWNVIMDKYPDEFPTDYPPTYGALAAVLKKFPTKQQLEDQWIEDNFPGFLKKVEEEVSVLVPTVLVRIIVGYARPIWTDVE